MQSWERRLAPLWALPSGHGGRWRASAHRSRSRPACARARRSGASSASASFAPRRTAIATACWSPWSSTPGRWRESGGELRWSRRTPCRPAADKAANPEARRASGRFACAYARAASVTSTMGTRQRVFASVTTPWGQGWGWLAAGALRYRASRRALAVLQEAFGGERAQFLRAEPRGVGGFFACDPDQLLVCPPPEVLESSTAHRAHVSSVGCRSSSWARWSTCLQGRNRDHTHSA